MFLLILLAVVRCAFELTIAATILLANYGRFESTALVLLILLYTQIQQSRIG